MASLARVPVARARSLTPSAVIGVATGAVLLAGAVLSAAAAI
ncbi:hypothetical protein AB0F72_38460 [Actinoplanes sp. NPDC023936]